VDFTRPVFSVDRCDLIEGLEGVTLAEADLKPGTIRERLIAAVSDAPAGSPGAQLLAHLQASAAGKPFNHAATVKRFFDACEARHATEKIAAGGRDVSAFLADLIKINSLNKKTAVELSGASGFRQSRTTQTGASRRPLIGPHPIFEFPDTMPMDEIAISASASPTNLLQVHPDARLSPMDCKLATEFVAIGTGTAGP
jgi:hypothetical protein